MRWSEIDVGNCQPEVCMMLISVSGAAEFPRVRRGAHCLPSLLLSQAFLGQGPLPEVPETYSIRIFAINIFVPSIFTA